MTRIDDNNKSDDNKENSIDDALSSADLIYTADQINAALDSLALKLNTRLLNENPLVLCVMKGGVVFTGQLLTRLSCMPDLDYIHVTRYQNQTSGNQLEWLVYPGTAIKNRTVLILDDILDQGITLNAIVEYCKKEGAKEVISAVLVHKKHERYKVDTHCDYIGLEVKDRYVFGFGMDYKGKLRNLNAIYALVE
jgi:hypoxanthine phosphoribosyltransferase